MKSVCSLLRSPICLALIVAAALGVDVLCAPDPAVAAIASPDLSDMAWAAVPLVGIGMLDMFRSDAFGVVALTDAINKQPYVPGRVSQLGIFEETGIPTTYIAIEEVDGTLKLIADTPRGAPGQQVVKDKRKLRNLRVPHLPTEDRINADEVQNVRQFGTSDQLGTVQAVVNGRLGAMARNLDATMEFHRIGAIKGTILDADGSTVLVNLFTEFGVVQDTVNFELTTGSTKVRNKCTAVARLIETALGAATYRYIHCLCGAAFFDELVEHAEVKKAYERWLAGEALRADVRKGFFFGDILFEEYRGKVGSTDFVGTNDAHFFPVGVPGLFVTRFAPADYVETINTLGLPRYAKQAVDQRFQKFVDLEAQTNPINLCTRPKVLVKGTRS